MSKFKICKKCSGQLEMYYSLWCPRCDKPEIITTKTLNLIKVLRFLIVNGEISEAEKKIIWPKIHFSGNNCHVAIGFNTWAKDIAKEIEDGFTEEEIENVAIIKVAKAIHKHYGDDNDILWEISW